MLCCSEVDVRVLAPTSTEVLESALQAAVLICLCVDRSWFQFLSILCTLLQ